MAAVSAATRQYASMRFIWLPLTVLPTLAAAFISELPAWMLMWSLAISIYIGFKWLTLVTHKNELDRLGNRELSYLFAWPGMDARTFLSSDRLIPAPRASAWLFALTKTAFGVILFWCVGRLIPAERWLVVGWIAMSGVVFILHFGIFHLIAIAWQSAGVDARPLMNTPIAAVSVADFWGRRWNLAFRDAAHALVFQPISARFGPVIAMLFVFVVSGIVHDVVISGVAGAGFGLPTLYFVLQGLCLLAERSRLGRRFGLGRGVTGRLFTVVAVLAPVGWLFHKPFIREIVLPMMRDLGALHEGA